MRLNRLELAKMIEHTILRPDATLNDIKRYCHEALRYGFRAVYVPPIYVKDAYELLKGSDVVVGSVVSFPYGFSKTSGKVQEALSIVEDGCKCVDMVMNICLFKDGRYADVEEDIRSVVKAVKEVDEEVEVKVIIETSLLTPAEIAIATKLVAKAGADFVKTCTGRGPRGVTVEDIAIIKRTLSEICMVDKVGIKASGSIRDLNKMVELIKAGASRIGTSTGVRIIEEVKANYVDL